MTHPDPSRPFDSASRPSHLTGPPTAAEAAPAFGPPQAPDDLGTLGPYRVVKELGHGGMGAVYLAVDSRLKRKVALKVMLPQFAAVVSAKDRFLREARTAATLTHDHIVSIFEADVTDGVPFIAMQYLQGMPLDAYLKSKGTPPWPQSVRIGRETALGLAEAHKHGVVHRDIKPANLWLEAPKGRVKILDFGLAKPRESDEGNLTASGAILGTPAYLAPEQARGERVDHRADLFSLGVVLYQLCTGQQPFTGTNILAILTALAVDEPRSERELNPAVPDALAELIQQLMCKNPDGRPASALAVAERLQQIKEGTADAVGSASMPVIPAGSTASVGDLSHLSVAIDATEPVAFAPPRPRRPLLLWGGVAAAFAAVAAAAFFALQPPSVPPLVAKKPDQPKPDAAPPKPTGPDARGRVPIPAREQIDAQKLNVVTPAERRQWVAEKSWPKRAELPRQLLQRGPSTPGDAKAFAELELAVELAVELADAPTAVAACDAMDNRFQIDDRRARKVEAMEKIAAKKPDGEVGRLFQNQLISLATASMYLDDDAATDRTLAVAKKFVTADLGDWFNMQVPLIEGQANDLRAGRAWVQPYQDRLKVKADDGEATGRVAEYTGLFRHEWTLAAKIAADAAGEYPCKAAFAKEKATPEKPTAAQCRAAGDAWWAVSEAVEAALQGPTRRRARYWYLKAMAKTTGPEREAFARDLVPRIDAVPTRPVALRIALFDTIRTHRVFFTPEGFQTNYQTANATEVQVNHMRWPNKVPFTKNEGKNWVYPYDLDFSTIRCGHGVVFGGEVLDWLHTPDGLEIGSYRNPDGRMTNDLRMFFQADGYPNPNRFTEQWAVGYHLLPADKGDLKQPETWERLFAAAPTFTGPVAEFEFRSINADYMTLSRFFKPPDPVRWTNFGLTATIEREYPAGKYELRMYQDDAARVLVDDKPVALSLTGAPTVAPLDLTAGKHRLRIEYVQHTGPLAFTHWLRRVGP